MLDTGLATLKLQDTARGAVIGAALGAIALAIREAIALGISAGDANVAWAAAGPACILGALGAVTALAIVLGTKGALVAMARQGANWSAVIGAIAGSTFAVLGAQALVLVVLSGQGIRTATVALSAALGVVAGIGLTLGLQALVIRLGWRGGLRARAAVVIGALFATLIGAIALAPGFVDELDVPGMLYASVPLLTSVIGAVWGTARRAFFRGAVVAYGAYGVLCAIGLAQALGTPPPKLALHIERGSHATRWVRGTKEALWPTQLAPIASRGTCKPGVKPGALIGARKAGKDAPDIVFITVDAVRWDHTTPGGYTRDTTPNLARWAKRAAVFTAAYSPSSSTRLSFRTMFSGLYPSLIPPSEGATWWGLTFPDKQHTLASYLAKAGYRTFAGNDGREGFHPKKGNALLGFNRLMTPEKDEKKTGAAKATRGVKRARYQISSLLQEVLTPRTEPLFAWTHVVAAHQPYSFEHNAYGNSEIGRYDAAIRFVDELVGKVLDTLEAEGRWNKTYVVLTADHGQAFGEHGNKLHGRTVYQEETNVPLMIWGPRIQAGLRSEPVGVVDTFATMLELAGLGTAPHTCGTSLVPWLRDPKVAAGRDVFIEKIPDARKDFAIAFIHGWHKLVVSPNSCSIEVFDVRKDKADRSDLSDEDPALTRKLVESLRAFQKERGMNPKSYCLD